MITIQEIASAATFDNPIKQAAAIRIADLSNAIEGVEIMANHYYREAQKTTGKESQNNLLYAQGLNKMIEDYFKQNK